MPEHPRQRSAALPFQPTSIALACRASSACLAGFAAVLSLALGAQAHAQTQATTGTAGTLTTEEEAAKTAVLPEVQITGRSDGRTEGTGSFTTQQSSTATGLGLSLRETPQSVTVMTRERIDEQNLNTLNDVLEYSPGIVAVTHGAAVGNRSQVYSRGYTVNSYQIDGMTMPWAAFAEASRYGHNSMDMAIYDSVAVVRGATGLLTGSGEPSASIGLTRKRPTRQFQGIVEGGLSRWSRGRSLADVGGPLNADGSVRGRVVGAYEKGKSYVEDYRDHKAILYGTLEADLSAATMLTASLEHMDNASRANYWHQSYGLPLSFTGGNPIPFLGRGVSMAPTWTWTDSNRTALSAKIEHHFNPDWKGSFNYSWSRFNTASLRAMVFNVPEDGTSVPVRMLGIDQYTIANVAAGKLEGKYPLLGRQHDLNVGFNLSQTRTEAPFYHYSMRGFATAHWTGSDMAYSEPALDRLHEASTPGQERGAENGLYAATRFRATDAFSLIGGARLSYWKTRSLDYDPYTITDERRYSSEITPYFGLVYDFTPQLSAYASYTEIFSPQYNKDVNGVLLDPEEGSNIELGLKGEWFDGRLNASIAAFESRKDNLAVADGDNTTPDGNQAYIAEDGTKGRGYELEVAGTLAPGWQIQGGYTHFRSKNSKGVRLNPGQPVQQFKLFTSYRLPMHPKLTLNGGLRWQSKTFSGNNGVPTSDRHIIDSYAIWNAGARYDFTDRLNLAVAVSNLTDKTYRSTPGSQTFGPPRNVTATLRYQFD